jgi:hypothetical protein
MLFWRGIIRNGYAAGPVQMTFEDVMEKVGPMRSGGAERVPGAGPIYRPSRTPHDMGRRNEFIGQTRAEKSAMAGGINAPREEFVMRHINGRILGKVAKRKDCRPRCQMCTTKIRGTQYSWGPVTKLCLHCYRSHCKHYITRANLQKKLRNQIQAPSSSTSLRNRNWWRKLFG